MNFLRYFHNALVTLFAVINGMMIYLFLMQIPYGLEPFFASLRLWDKLSPQIGYMLGIASILTIAAILLCHRLSIEWKNRLLYFRRDYPHPAFNAFLNNRKQPFESNTLLRAHPAIKDSGFNPQTQIDTWEKVHKQHSSVPVVLNTRIHWQMLRDLYLISIFFLPAFLISWLWQIGVPFQYTAIYVFVFGAQTLFLFLTARRIGWKFIDNVLAVDLGMKEGEGMDTNKRGKKPGQKKF
jgi:hypothetical protein